MEDLLDRKPLKMEDFDIKSLKMEDFHKSLKIEEFLDMNFLKMENFLDIKS